MHFCAFLFAFIVNYHVNYFSKKINIVHVPMYTSFSRHGINKPFKDMKIIIIEVYIEQFLKIKYCPQEKSIKWIITPRLELMSL